MYASNSERVQLPGQTKEKKTGLPNPMPSISFTQALSWLEGPAEHWVNTSEAQAGCSSSRRIPHLLAFNVPLSCRKAVLRSVSSWT